MLLKVHCNSGKSFSVHCMQPLSDTVVSYTYYSTKHTVLTINNMMHAHGVCYSSKCNAVRNLLHSYRYTECFSFKCNKYCIPHRKWSQVQYIKPIEVPVCSIYCLNSNLSSLRISLQSRDMTKNKTKIYPEITLKLWTVITIQVSYPYSISP